MKKLIIAIFVFGYTHGSAQSFFESFEDWNSISSILYPANWSTFPEIDSVLLNVERVNAINHGQYSLNLKSNIPHWKGILTLM